MHLGWTLICPYQTEKMDKSSALLNALFFIKRDKGRIFKYSLVYICYRKGPVYAQMSQIKLYLTVLTTLSTRWTAKRAVGKN